MWLGAVICVLSDSAVQSAHFWPGGSEEVAHLISRQRLGEHIALHITAVHGGQLGGLFFGLHAFRDDFHAEVGGEVDDSADDFGVLRDVQAHDE